MTHPKIVSRSKAGHTPRSVAYPSWARLRGPVASDDQATSAARLPTTTTTAPAADLSRDLRGRGQKGV